MFRRINLRTKLFGAFTVLLALLVVIAITDNLVHLASQERLDELDHHQQVVDEFNDVLWSVSQMQSNFRTYLMYGEPALLSLYNAASARLEDSFDDLRKRVLLDPDQFGRIASIEQDIRDWRREIIQPGLQTRRPGAANSADDALALEYLQRMGGVAHYTEITQQLTDGLVYEQRILADLEREATRFQRFETLAIIAGSTVIIATGAVMSAWLARDIAGAVDAIGAQARRIASGELHARINSTRGDEIGRVAGVFDDMAEQLERMDRELRETAASAQEREQQLRTIVDNVAEGLVSFCANGAITSYNPAAQRMFGFADGEMMNGSMLEMLQVQRSSRPLKIDDLIPADGETLLRTVDGVRTDGSTFPVEVVVNEIPQRQPRELMAVLRDVSEHQEAEARLRERVRAALEAETKTRAVLDATGDAMVVVSDDNQLLMANQPYADFFQTTPDVLVGLTIDQILESAKGILEDVEHVTHLVQAGIDHPDEQVVDRMTLLWPVRREVEYSSMPVLMADGERLGRLYAFRDITHEREVERMKNHFVSLVSHELRTPMTSIKGYVDLLLDEEVGDLTEDQREFLRVVQSNVQRLVLMVNELLDISRIEAGKMDLQIAPVDVPPLVRRVIAELSPLIEERRHDVSLHSAPDLIPAAADADRFGQIVTNLLSNAVKYTPPGGKITIRIRNEDNNCVLEVSDTGVGLDEDEIRRLFTRFFRAKNRATREASGSGLGLSITKALVEMHGGSISVKSAPGEGSTFTVLLPSVNPVATSHLPSLQKDASSGSVLLIEDDRDIANLIARYLRRSGHSVSIASDAATAKELFRTQAFDLVTLDIVLPDLDGFSLLEAMREMPVNRDVPVVVISMLADDGTGRDLGAVDYMVKPVHEQDFVEHISRILRGSRAQTVLVAEDDDDLRRVIVSELRQRGHKTAEAADGRQAVDVAHRMAVDLVLLDVWMPEMDGIATLAELRNSPATRSMPVILMTGDQGLLDERAEGQGPVTGEQLLSKSLSPRHIAELIDKALLAQGAAGE